MSIVRCYWCDTDVDTDLYPETCPVCGEPIEYEDKEPTDAQMEAFYDGPSVAETRERDEKQLRQTGRR